MKVIQYSTTWCGHCPGPAKYLQGSLPKDDFIWAMLDTGEIIYGGEESEDSISEGLIKAIEQTGQPKSVPHFVITDDEYNVIEQPRGRANFVEQRYKELSDGK